MSQLTLTKQGNGFFQLSFENDGFSASALLYHTHLLAPFAASLTGFPASLGQVIEFRQEPDSAHEDTICIRVSCIDDSGHVAIELSIESTVQLSGNFKRNAARLYMTTEPTHIVRFSSQLSKAVANEHEVAILAGS